jgi:hypothetical protein
MAEISFERTPWSNMAEDTLPGHFGAPSATLGISPAGSDAHPSTAKPAALGTPRTPAERLNFDCAPMSVEVDRNWWRSAQGDRGRVMADKATFREGYVLSSCAKTNSSARWLCQDGLIRNCSPRGGALEYGSADVCKVFEN